MKFVSVLILFCILLSGILFGQIKVTGRRVSLAWDGVTEAIGYKVYSGATSRSYVAPISGIMGLTYTTDPLPVGSTRYFAVTAYDATQESGFSNEVSARIYSACDLNQDDLENVQDLQNEVNLILGTGICPSKCDINYDGQTNVQDLQILINTILRVSVCGG